jgi:hypothetical protein
MGVHALLLRTLPAAGELPIFVHDPDRGMQPFGRRARQRLVSQFLEIAWLPSGSASLHRLPIDSTALGLSEQEQLEFHARYGLTEEALTAVVTSLLEDDGSTDHDTRSDNNGADTMQRGGEPHVQVTSTCTDERCSILAFGLIAAIRANNFAATVSLIQHVAPKLLLSSKTQASRPAFDSLTYKSVALEIGLGDCSDFVACLHALAREAHPTNILAPVVAMVTLDDFASGRMLPRIVDSRKRLESWLRKANSPMFRMQSWQKLTCYRSGGDAPALSAFVTHKAIENRHRFYGDLVELEHLAKSRDLLQGMQKLQGLIDQLYHPCMRLEILQSILGLDEQFDLQTLNTVSNLANSVISNAVKLGIAMPEGTPPVLPTNTGNTPLFQLKATASRLHVIDLNNPCTTGSCECFRGLMSAIRSLL